MRNLKNKKGITLVALIITIIVLLILAMVSISLVINSGIITKSKDSVDKYSEEEIGEQLKLAYSEYQMAVYSEGANDATAFVKARLKNTFGDSLDEDSVTVANGEVKATINGKKYDYDIATGIAGEHVYVDPFDYGTGKTKETVTIGDVITLTKDSVTESFTVLSNVNGKIVAIPKYNITLTTNHPIQSSTAEKTEFSSDNYWAKETGWNDSSKVKDNSVNIDMTAKNTDGTYKNNIQQYIEAYELTLNDMGAEGITVRACTRPELDSELGAGLETTLTNSQKLSIRNPGQILNFWLGSAYSDNRYPKDVCLVNNAGNFASIDGTTKLSGVRPVIEIH